MLELKNINFTVNDENTGEEKEILKNINIKFETGHFIVITGPNGGGKSTLAKIIMGLETPTSGQIIFNGEDITNLSINERAKLGIGFAFQQPVRFKGLKVKDLLRLAAGKDISTEKACEHLSKVGLCAQDYIDRELNESLSGGEMKRIEIAMLMARNIQLSLFDEPEAGIDLWSFHNLIAIFKHLRDSTNGSLIIISHQERILEIADEIVIIKDGEISEYGSKEEMLPKLLGNVDICNYYRKEA
ncbi:MAG: ATP-binding cassette domain-containing protein [Tissierellia bacterium]|nr:ATP-binding cassette domain-containing protein [Tissierellia bacterium]